MEVAAQRPQWDVTMSLMPSLSHLRNQMYSHLQSNLEMRTGGTLCPPPPGIREEALWSFATVSSVIDLL